MMFGKKKTLTYSDEEIQNLLTNPVKSSGEVLIERAEKNKIFSDEDEVTGLIGDKEEKKLIIYFLVFTLAIFLVLVVLYYMGYGISLYGVLRGGK
jgi:nitrate reductase NapE component